MVHGPRAFALLSLGFALAMATSACGLRAQGIGAPESAEALSAAPGSVCPPAPERGTDPPPGPGGYPGQSNAVPPGFPTPTTWAERLRPGGPARDPGPLDWAQPGPYIAPDWLDFTLQSYGPDQRVVTTYYFYW